MRRRAAIAAAAAAVRRRPGGAAAPAWHRRGARPARRGREPAGPSADPADLRDPPSHHHQRPAAHAGRARAHRPAMAAVPRRAAGGRHQPGRPVLPRGSGQRHAGHAVPFRHAVGRHGRRQGASVLGLHLLSVPVAAQLARPCAAAQRRSLRGPVHAAELPVHRAGPPHGGGGGQIRAPAGGRRAAGRTDETRVPARPRGARRRRDPALLPRIRRHHLSSFGHGQDGAGRRSAGSGGRAAARARRGRTARGRLLGHADAGVGQHECARDHAGRARGRIHIAGTVLPATPGAASLEACTRTGEAGATAAR